MKTDASIGRRASRFDGSRLTNPRFTADGAVRWVAIILVTVVVGSVLAVLVFAAPSFALRALTLALILAVLPVVVFRATRKPELEVPAGQGVITDRQLEDIQMKFGTRTQGTQWAPDEARLTKATEGH